MPKDHFWIEAPFGYSSQTLNMTEGNLIDQAGQNLEVVDIIESTQAFKKVLKDAVPQMVNSMTQDLDNSLKQGQEKMLQDIVRAFLKMKEQASRQDTVSKLVVSHEEFGNSAKIDPSVQPITDERYIPPHIRDEVWLNNKVLAPNGLNG